MLTVLFVADAGQASQVYMGAHPLAHRSPSSPYVTRLSKWLPSVSLAPKLATWVSPLLQTVLISSWIIDYSVQSMVPPNCVSKCRFFSTFTSISPDGPTTLFSLIPTIVSYVPFHLGRSVLNRARKALGPRNWVDCSQEDSTLTILLAAMFLQSFTHRGWRFREHKAAPRIT